MCGIAGILHFNSSENRPNANLVRRMTDVLTHRGPDDSGIWLDNSVGLGHRRLSIIDLSKHGRQPMSNEDGSIQITYNGELYNFLDLKKRFSLVERGHKFQSRTDTEVLVHLFEEISLEMLSELNGMYAFAIWDARKKELHLVRDRYGIKPLFYTKQNDRFIFASEIKAILQDDKVPRRVNLQAMHDFLTFDYIPGEQTAFEGIYEVPPAHVLTINSEGQIKLQRFWQPTYAIDENISETEASETALELMEQAVQRQIVADVPVGVLLSGGMDSSALAALMAKQKGEPIHTFSVGFEDKSFNELPFARIVAQAFGTHHREVIVTSDLVREMLPKYLSSIDEPYADGSAIPTYYVCQLARNDVKVVLSGEGGDEVFTGYDTHAAYKVSKWFNRIPRLLRKDILQPLVNMLPVSHKKLSLEFKIKRFLGGQDLPPDEAHLWWRIVLDEKQKLKLYNPNILKDFTPQPSVRFFQNVFRNSNADNDLNRILNIDTAVFLPDDLMIKNDRMSMAHSLEARVPFTDNDLASYMERVPPRLKLKGLKKKNIMRLALRDVLPQEILNKKKVGLEMPYSHWLRGELKDVLFDYCSPARLSETGLFNPAGVTELIEQHLTGKYDHGRALWGMLNFMMWLELYIPQPAEINEPVHLKAERQAAVQ
ncbi:MAG: asparagine synthase (glutamine-hydrolyzing) [Acidobacteriota bacterium]